MIVRDVMTWNVVTVPGDTPIMEARKIMKAHKIRRLPVMDKGKLIGVVSIDAIERTGPSPATTLSVWEVNYLLSKMTVKEIMKKDPLTVTPDMNVEVAIALAQKNHVGALPVVEADSKQLIGIVTTNDFFYKILNPTLGIGQPGVRLNVANCYTPECIADVMQILGKYKVKLLGIHNMGPIENSKPELFVHLDIADPAPIVKDLAGKGYIAEVRQR
jgi:acetoin utilization protein AcuB